MRDEDSRSNCIISIEEKLVQAKKADDSNKWGKVRIYRVPRSIKCRNPARYEPKVVSFGPYHRSNPNVCEADALKWRVLHYMLNSNNLEVAQYVEAVRDLEEYARSCYEEEILLSSDEFVEMMVLDGCFLLYCLLLWAPNWWGDADIPILYVTDVILDVFSDMMLVENQIPLAVLCIIASKQCSPVIKEKQLIHLIDTAASYLIMGGPPNSLMDKEAFHILGIVMNYQASNKPKESFNGFGTLILFPCASKLKKVDVKFSAREDDKHWLIDFSGRTLTLSKLYVHGGSEIILHNAVAYEQCQPDCDKVISPYCIFMSQLIRSSKDVELLIEAKIIIILEGSHKKVVKLFSDIDVTVNFSKGSLSDVVEGLNRHNKTISNKWKANLKDTYFRNPWAFTSLLAASFIIILASFQTFFTVFPRKSS